MRGERVCLCVCVCECVQIKTFNPIPCKVAWPFIPYSLLLCTPFALIGHTHSASFSDTRTHTHISRCTKAYIDTTISKSPPYIPWWQRGESLRVCYRHACTNIYACTLSCSYTHNTKHMEDSHAIPRSEPPQPCRCAVTDEWTINITLLYCLCLWRCQCLWNGI